MPAGLNEKQNGDLELSTDIRFLCFSTQCDQLQHSAAIMTSMSHWTLPLKPQDKKSLLHGFCQAFCHSNKSSSNMMSNAIVSLIIMGVDESVTFSPMYRTERKKMPYWRGKDL